jgi:hypothetical protein
MDEAELPACASAGVGAGSSRAGAQEDEGELVGPPAPPPPPPGCPAAQDEGGPDGAVSMESAEAQPMSLSAPGVQRVPSLERVD